MSKAHFTADCVHCGAPQPLTLSAPIGPCVHCGQPAPIAADLRARLNGLRTQLAGRNAKPRQLTAKALVAGDALHGVGAITIGICWALFGSVAVYVSLDHDVPLGRFLTSGEPAEQWWLLWAFALGLPLSVALLEGAVVRVRGLSAQALPAPPAHAGAQPRCRCCAAELPIGGALRRCAYCFADNLVISGRYLRAEDKVDRAIERMSKSFDQDLKARIDAGDTIAMTGGVAPFFLLFLGPVIGILVPGSLQLWALPGAIVVLALLLAVWARLRRLPVDALELLTLGQNVYVRGADKPKRRVCAQLMLPGGPVSLLAYTLDEVEIAVRVQRGTHGRDKHVYRVERAAPHCRRPSTAASSQPNYGSTTRTARRASWPCTCSKPPTPGARS